MPSIFDVLIFLWRIFKMWHAWLQRTSQYLRNHWHQEKLPVQCTEETPSLMYDVMIPETPFILETVPVQCTERSSSTVGLIPYKIPPVQCSEIPLPIEHLTPYYPEKQPVQCTEISSPLEDFIILVDDKLFASFHYSVQRSPRLKMSFRSANDLRFWTNFQYNARNFPHLKTISFHFSYYQLVCQLV
ncbi:hypothetical protein OS493_023353 [Desmophyllum pertusum]|uniref:Uncharacterized protein n=1 Tax=Desmophyllum pertusum TaxID=174260 RepID=A0A9X0D7V1_9CNID|nr:hypothetical protein OS493_023353 [Desmophyllum pertusum]